MSQILRQGIIVIRYSTSNIFTSERRIYDFNISSELSFRCSRYIRFLFTSIVGSVSALAATHAPVTSQNSKYINNNKQQLRLSIVTDSSYR